MSPAIVTMQNLAQPFVAASYIRLRGGIVLAPGPAVSAVKPIHAEPNVITERAVEQHTVFVRRLQAMGVALDLTECDPHGIGFAAADLAVIVDRGAILMRPSAVERHSAVDALETMLTERQIPIVGRIEAPGLLDGADILLGGDTAYIGVPRGRGTHASRSNALGREQFAGLSGLRVVEVPVHADYPRLSSVATLADASTVVLGGEAVDAAPFDGLQQIVLPLGEEYAAGMLPLGERRMVANLRFRQSPGILKKAKIALESLDVWEFGKLGFSPSALVLAVSRR